VNREQLLLCRSCSFVLPHQRAFWRAIALVWCVSGNLPDQDGAEGGKPPHRSAEVGKLPHRCGLLLVVHLNKKVQRMVSYPLGGGVVEVNSSAAEFSRLEVQI
jgi:hypothetical protein